MTDPTIPLALSLIVSLGLAARFYLRTLDMGNRAATLEADREFLSNRVAQQDATIAELLERLESTEAALHKAVAAEWPRGAA